MIKKLKVLFLSLLITAGAGNMLCAATRGAEFLKIAVGARPAGLAGAFVAVADETSGMYYNPAGLAYSLSPEFQAMYALWLGELAYTYAGYSHPTENGTFGLGIRYLAAPSTAKIVNGVASGDINYYDGAADFSYSVKMGAGAAFGLNLRGIQSQIDSNNLAGFTGDAGVLFKTPEEGFAFGIAGSNLFGEFGKDRLPLEGRLGMAFKADMPEHNSDILFTVEGGQPENGPLYLAAGLEHWGAKTLGLRVGYKHITNEKQYMNTDSLYGWNAGISLRVQSVAIDYSYQPFSALGVAHRFSVSWKTFGWGKRMKEVPAALKAEPALFSPNNDGAKDSVFFIPDITEIKEVKSWELDILDADKLLVKKFTGQDVLPKILSWEGQTDAGGLAPEGRYYYRMTAIGDGNKRAVSNMGEILADITAPTVSVNVSTSIFSPKGGPLSNITTFFMVANDANGVDQWQLGVYNKNKKQVKIVKGMGDIRQELVWNGIDDYYNSAVPEGEYEIRLTAWDNAGNKVVAASGVTVVNPPPKLEIKEVQVKEEKRGLVVNLSSQVLFALGKSKLKPEAARSLDEVIQILQAYPENMVSIEGHTDSTGSRKRNHELSSARAWSVYSYLVKGGVVATRLSVRGVGPDKPIASNKTRLGRARNRRVEIIILKNQ